MKKDESEIWFDRIFIGSYVPVNLRGWAVIIFGPLTIAGFCLLGKWFHEYGKKNIEYAPAEFLFYILAAGAYLIISIMFIKHSGQIKK